MLFRFVHEMQVGDYVVFPSKSDRMIYFGVIEGNYVYAETASPYVQQRKDRLEELFDLAGRLVGTKPNGLESIDMSAMPSGVYMLRVTMKDGTSYREKILKE